MKDARYWIEKLELLEHPEGGWYKEVYRSDESIPENGLPARFNAGRSISTSIYYLLEKENKSHFHRIKSDELWHYYSGNSAIEILIIRKGKLERLLLGSNFEEGESFQLVVPKNCWFAAHLINKDGFALVGCTVSPGFHFEDFEMAEQKELLQNFPEFIDTIKQFTTGS